MMILDSTNVDNILQAIPMTDYWVYRSQSLAETPVYAVANTDANHAIKANDPSFDNGLGYDAKSINAVPHIWIPATNAPALVESTVVALVKQDERTAPLTEKLVAKDYVPSKAGRVADIIQVLAKEGLSIASRAKSGGAVKEVIEAPVEKAPVEAVATKG